MNEPITAADCQAALKKHGNKSDAAQAMGMSRSSFCRRLAGSATKKVKEPSPSQGRSLAEFRLTYDKDTIYPQKIEAAIAQIGKDGWTYEVEFAKLAGLGLAQLATYREAYAEYVVQLGRDSKRAWAGSKAMATKMRGML